MLPLLGSFDTRFQQLSRVPRRDQHPRASRGDADLAHDFQDDF